MRKRKPVIKQLYKLKNVVFTSIEDMKHRLKSVLNENLAGDIGYYEGKQSMKRWLLEDEDVSQMYTKGAREICLWFERSYEDKARDEVPKEKKKKEENIRLTRREEKEKNIDKAFEELSERHNDYSKPQLKLWARMIVNEIHESYDQPPNVPLITGMIPKQSKKNKESISEVIAGAATAFVKAVCPHTPTATETVNESSCVSISPGKTADVRMKNLQQLRYLQQLFHDNILTESEYLEQKNNILQSLRTL